MAEYIEREAALHVLGTMPLDWEYGRGVSDCYDAIKAIPAADVARVRHAYWIPHIGQNGRGDGWNCSAPECGEFSCCAGAYCPNCGAQMDGKETEE